MRFIPACAGNRNIGLCSPTLDSVHPRVCGEQLHTDLDRMLPVGSSPRVRGTVNILGRTSCSFRFIPACAGNSGRAVLSLIDDAVHPRVCGEQARVPRSDCHQVGSSPRVRGTECDCVRKIRSSRFIPACAGNRLRGRSLRSRRSVHPRVCGEQRGSIYRVRGDIGSSPRVRGTAQRIYSVRGRSRFIPACAGNRIPATRPPPFRPVHPRVCGEQASIVDIFAIFFGSSPRVRGTVKRPLARRQLARFIPACAGNRRHRTICDRLRPVHPRVCGEQLGALSFRYSGCGSSPRVRGTETKSIAFAKCLRFIPACAGNRVI